MSFTLPLPTTRPRRRTLLILATTLGWGFAACSQVADDANRVSLETARAEFEAGRAVLIDIREPQEHATGVAAGAQLLPMRQLGRRLAEIPNDPSRPVLLICNTQNRSGSVLKALRERGGYGNVRYVEGGMSGWAQRGWPMVKPPQP
jgi:rhodanese-related sulfurtransferase